MGGVDEHGLPPGPRSGSHPRGRLPSPRGLPPATTLAVDREPDLIIMAADRSRSPFGSLASPKRFACTTTRSRPPRRFWRGRQRAVCKAREPAAVPGRARLQGAGRRRATSPGASGLMRRGAGIPDDGDSASREGLPADRSARSHSPPQAGAFSGADPPLAAVANRRGFPQSIRGCFTPAGRRESPRPVGLSSEMRGGPDASPRRNENCWTTMAVFLYVIVCEWVPRGAAGGLVGRAARIAPQEVLHGSK